MLIYTCVPKYMKVRVGISRAFLNTIQTYWSIGNPSAWRRRQWIPKTHWLVELKSSKFKWETMCCRVCKQNTWCQPPASVCVCTHAHLDTFSHPYTCGHAYTFMHTMHTHAFEKSFKMWKLGITGLDNEDWYHMWSRFYTEFWELGVLIMLAITADSQCAFNKFHFSMTVPRRVLSRIKHPVSLFCQKIGARAFQRYLFGPLFGEKLKEKQRTKQDRAFNDWWWWRILKGQWLSHVVLKTHTPESCAICKCRWPG